MRTRRARFDAPMSLAAMCGVLLCCLGAPAARAGMMVEQAFISGNFGAASVINNRLAGYRFVPQRSITVTALGVADPFLAGNQPAIEVGMFRESDQALLTSATVPGGTARPLEGGSRFVDIDHVDLVGGEGYRIAMFIPEGPNGFFNLSGGRQNHPLIEFGTRYFHAFNIVGMEFPSSNPSQGNLSGPNFQFIPTPGAVALIALAGVFLAGRSR